MERIYARVADSKNQFYIEVEGRSYYLFEQAYRASVNKLFRKGLPLEDAMQRRSYRDTAINRTQDKFVKYIKYIEKEYGVSILKRSKTKACQNHKCKSPMLQEIA